MRNLIFNSWGTKTAAVVLLASSVLIGPTYADQFNFNDGSLQGLTTYNPLSLFGAGATYSFPSGALRIQAPASPNPALVGPARAGAYAAGLDLTTFMVSVDLVSWDNTLEQAIGVMGRGGQVGLGTSRGYEFAYYVRGISLSAPQVAISRIDNESATLLSSVSLTLNPQKDYRLELFGAGSTLMGLVYDLSDLSVPLNTLVVQDTTYTSGSCGLMLNGVTGGSLTTLDATFDNLTIIPEPSVWALGLLGVAMFFKSRRG